MKHLRFGLALLMLVGVAACYRTTGRPYKNVESVSVKVFTNKTLYRDLDFQITDHLRREISALTPCTIGSPRKADAIFQGEVSDYAEVPEAIDKDEVVTTWRLTAKAAYKLVDNHTGEVIASSDGVKWSEVYAVRAGRTLAEVRDETLRKLAQRIVEQAFMPWPEAEASAGKRPQE